MSSDARARLALRDVDNVHDEEEVRELVQQQQLPTKEPAPTS